MHKILQNILPLEEIDQWLNAVEKSVGSIEQIVSYNEKWIVSEGRGEHLAYMVVIWVKERKRVTSDKKVIETMSPEQFNEFWKACPRKIGKGAAENAFMKLEANLFDKILTSMKAHSKNWTLTNTDPKYIPHPATWLNQKRWEDDLRGGERAQMGDLDYYNQEQ